MWNETPFARRLGIQFPIVQGPLGGGASSVKLLSLVSNAGGLGSYGMQAVPGSRIRGLIHEIRSATDKPFSVNLWMPKPAEEVPVEGKALAAGIELLRPYYSELGIDLPTHFSQKAPDLHEQMAAILDARPPVFSFVFGIPSMEFLQACKARNILTMGTAASVEEAIALEKAGIDCIVASGYEAGGHKDSFLKAPEGSMMGTFALLPQVMDHVSVPVIAAGGIADARGLAAALALGAHGVQIGTAFLACDESTMAPMHRAILLDVGPKKTQLSRAFSGRLARGLRNRLMDELDNALPPVLPYPAQSALVDALNDAACKQGRTDLISIPAGQAVALVRSRSAEDLMEELVRETPRILQRVLSAGAPTCDT